MKYLITFLFLVLLIGGLTACENTKQSIGITTKPLQSGKNFEKINGRTTADTSQQRHFVGDKGFEFSALTIRDIKWGRE